ncbi:aspartate aminotransferase family protein [Marivivens donghaensis]|uniref:Aspartate aminotransferase family protein n=1 Tax=Marivivens donghaensis TaxID=1699413 RepID=A0ABX0W2K9_9RHOB|nr:aspartate aminotransferase family protein [Marivivens donghaensis]NIY73711.1 aspartate aminotransferase family protein [Marivivens donghaensis]
MTHIFGRSTRGQLPTAVAGDGCYLIDASGKRYLDGSGGAAVSCLGHSNARVRAALHEQLDQVAFAHTGFFTSDPAERLADRLTAAAPEGIDRVYLVSGGSEAVEAAIKLARQYFMEIGQPQRHRVIARRQSYHGNTLGALATGGNEWRRAQFAPLLVETSHISPCYEYRGREEGETIDAYGLRVANELETEIERLGAESVMAFVAEPVVGATSGAVPAVKGYLKRIREICDKHGILLILDEVMCGMGRTGYLFACQEDGISPDMITIAKGLGAGYQPIGALLVQGKIYDAIAAGSGFFQHGHTYMGHAMAAAAANAVLSEIEENDLLARVRTQGEKLQAALEAEFGQHPHVGDIRGRGLFRGVEFVADRDTKDPFDPARKLNAKIKKNAFDAGLVCYPMGGTIDGVRGDHVLLAPPFVIEDAQIDELVSKLSGAVEKALAE